jgi:hypothetical protein
MAFPRPKPPTRAFQKPKEPTFPFAEGMGYDIADQAVEHDIDEVEGKLIKLYDVKPAGRTTVQNGTLQTKFGDIKIAYWGGEIPKDAVMKTWRILGTGDKFGRITYKIESYEGKNGPVTNETLSIGNKSEWVQETANAAARQTNQTNAQRQGSEEEAAKHGHERESKEDLPWGNEESIVDDTAAGNLAIAAKNLADQHRIVFNTVAAVYEDLPIKDDTLQAFVATIWIGLDRAGVVHPNIQIAHSGPVKTRSEVAAPKEAQTATEPPKAATGAYDPMNWAAAIIPSGSLAGQKLGAIGKTEIEKLVKYSFENEKKEGFWSCVRQAADDLDILPF